MSIYLRLVTSGVSDGVASASRLIGGLTNDIRRHFESVAAYNRQLQNGGAALNGIIQAGAAAFGLAKLNEYSAMAKEAREAQAQLDQTLRQTGQDNGGYAKWLDEQARALQDLTGIEDDHIKHVQRILIANGVQAQDMQRFVELTLDMAKAKRIDEISAAQAIGRGLSGDDIELGRYGIHIDKTLGRGQQLREFERQGTQMFGGQAQAAFQAEGAAGRMRVELKKNKEELGDLVLNFKEGFATGIIAPIEKAVDWLKRFSGDAKDTGGTAHDLGEELGKIAGYALPLIAVGTALGAISAALKIILPLVALTRVGWFAMITPLINTGTAVQGLSANFGVLQSVLAGGGWAMLQTGIILALSGLIGWLAGTFINELKISGIKIGDWLAGFAAAWMATMTNVATNVLIFWERVKGTFKEIGLWLKNNFTADLKYAQATILQIYASFKEFFGGDATAYNEVISQYIDEALAANAEGSKEQRELLAQVEANVRAIRQAGAAQYNDYVGLGADILAGAMSPDQRNNRPGTTKTAAPAAPQKSIFYDANNLLTDLAGRDADNRKKLAELQLAQKSLDDQLATLEAQKQAVDDQLITRRKTLDVLFVTMRWADYLKGIGEAETEARVKTLEVEQQIEEVKRKQFKVQADLQDKQIQALELQLKSMEASPFLADYEKQAQSLPILEQQNTLLEQQIGLTRRLAATPHLDETTRVLYQDRIDKLSQKQAEVQAAMVANAQLNVPQQTGAQLAALKSQFGTTAQQIASILTVPIGTAISSITDGITDLIRGTKSWGEVFTSIGDQIVTSIIRMTVQALAFAAVMFIVNALTGGAVALGGGAFGGLIGTAGIGYASGGYTGDGPESEIAGPAHRGEVVFHAAAVRRLGVPLLESLRLGRPMVATSIPGYVGLAPSTGSADDAGGGGGSRSVNLTLAVAGTESEVRRIQQSRATEQQVLDIFRRNRVNLGIG